MKILVSLFVVIVTAHCAVFSDSLDEEQQQVYEKIIRTYDLQKQNFDGSLKEAIDKNIPEALNLKEFAAWYATSGYDMDKIEENLLKREKTLFPTAADSYYIAPPTTGFIGDSTAPFKIVAYVSSNCPHCKKVCIPLSEMVETGDLKGKASLAIKPIHQRTGDYALLAAHTQGKTWELFREMGKSKKRLDEEVLLTLIESAGLDLGKLTNELEKDAKRLEEQISKNYNECKRNGLEFTPTLYINGVRYWSNKKPLWIADYIEFLLRKRGQVESSESASK